MGFRGSEQMGGLGAAAVGALARSVAGQGWNLAIASVLAASATVYGVGLIRLWRNAGRGHGITWINLCAFALGIGALIVALLSPLVALSEILFSAHMGQHELLMLVAAPLVVMGKPWLTAAWALPANQRAAALGLLQRPELRLPWRTLTGPAVILLLHALALWIWHVPGLFDGALRNRSVHAFQHLCFFVTAVLFWWALVQGRYGRAGYGAAALFVFITAMHSGILGALITMAGRPWYPLQAARTHAAGVDALQDQQLAGLLMWIPAGVLLALFGLALLAAWLGEGERRTRAADAALSRQLSPKPGGGWP
jgi:putative membrane protein